LGNGVSPVNPGVYPFTDPVFQQFNAQQYLNYGTGIGPGGAPIVQEDTATAPAERPTNDASL
jgi:hypothetical protein